jgi:glutathione S-transferase
MPDALHLAALDTILAVFITVVLAGRVGRARHKYKIEAPAMVGHPDFERACRAHMNTVESLVMFLPALWVAAIFYGGQVPFWIGLVWIVGRIAYTIGYAQQNTQMRGPGAGLSFLSILALLALGALGALR